MSYITEFYKNDFISAAGDSGLAFSDQMSTIETASMMNGGGINITQLRVLLRILRHKICTKVFESETKITDLCGKMMAT